MYTKRKMNIFIAKIVIINKNVVIINTTLTIVIFLCLSLDSSINVILSE